MDAQSDGTAVDMISRSPKAAGNTSAIFVHAGAGYHSRENEHIHLQACTDASNIAMRMLRNGCTAVDAVEMAIKVLEDRKITNSGYGSNLCIDGVVECDATIVDEYGRSGAAGAVCQIRNPISLARLILLHSLEPLSLRRVPPNLLVGEGARDFAEEHGMGILPHDALVTPTARERWITWKEELRKADSASPDHNSETGSNIDPDGDLGVDYEEQARRRSRAEHVHDMHASIPSNRRLRMPKFEPSIKSASSPAAHSDSEPPPRKSGSIKTPSPAKRSAPSCSSSPDVRRSPGGPKGRESARSPTPRLGQGHGIYADQLTQLQRGIEEKAATTTSHDPSKEVEIVWHDGPSESDSSPSSLGSSLILPSVSPSPPPYAALHTPLPPSPHSESPGSGSASPAAQPEVLRPTASLPGMTNNSSALHEDHITDTVGAIAVDSNGNIAAGSSSGGIGMKHRGRVGPAALVGIGTAVIPEDPEDRQKMSVATVCSGTGEHMATTMAAATCADRLYHSVRKQSAGRMEFVTDSEVMESVIQKDFMDHPSVRQSPSVGAIGILAVKKTRDGIYVYFAHNTDSFAVASMHSDDRAPTTTMSRNSGNNSVAQGGRGIRLRRK